MNVEQHRVTVDPQTKPTDVTSATTLPVFCARLKTYLFSVSFPA